MEVGIERGPVRICLALCVYVEIFTAPNKHLLTLLLYTAAVDRLIAMKCRNLI